ncbi:probable protein phosphatase 2C T23F11.1 [Cimex lectularius]|uniref:protein-serine/threonine phosphatase n=1 Tax=Cimex lectularius TaxID=79782 RepID=A0A8I6SC97_CIMLE|nr:probable protein phosphatase 2C T23F11.1 [Cimex lectularius]
MSKGRGVRQLNNFVTNGIFGMGITLSQPITEKHTFTFENEKFKGAVSSMQGWRVTMEDAHSVYMELPGDPTASYFAVYDGHSGPKVAEFASRNLHKYVVKNDLFQRGFVKDAMKAAFLDMDVEMREREELQDDMSGSTAIVVLIKEGSLFCANLGDSRAIAVIDGHVHALSFDHKPNTPSEYERIVEAGGWVEFNRVNGNLAVSRAFGDFVYKMNENRDQEKQSIIALPDVTETKLNERWEFILLACDGIWDVLSNTDVGEFVSVRIQQGKPPDAICEDLLNRCLSPVSNYGGTGCDNMTVILVLFMKNKKNQIVYSKPLSKDDSPASIQ